MRAVVQRVTESSVTVDGQITGATDEGLVVLIGVEEGDTDKDAGYIADKVSGLRIFEDENEKMNLSVKDVGGSILAISQFTLLGDVRKGKRPSFINAEDPEIANRLYKQVCENIRNQGLKVETGIFQAHMLVKINNNGPVTILLDSRKTF
ncbi:MAG: D-aminoacyl-tRNA deacylase [Clostridia bacterium]|nr:D-aminoacyl-tRNA deacylase [Clostridia bacterium]